MSYYPYYGYPYRYGYGYGCGYNSPYTIPLLNNEYKLNGLYNEIDELNDMQIQNAILSNREIKVPTEHGLHKQLKNKNAELVQHIVKKDAEIYELSLLLKKHNTPHSMDASMNHSLPHHESKNRFYPGLYHHYPHPHYPYPHYPYPYPDYPPYLYRDGKDAMTETHTVHRPSATHVIIPRAIQPNYSIPSQAHIPILPCVLPPHQPQPQ